ncbi:MAG: hypothetical protein L0Z48_00115 [candidate division Zixibacteria bacterium]|nr:hypothetical protein [candidate division Zixibacteria bacterium]MCI0594931.1 hypothetical protein [candidate division Zixibacteria bacterium]
MSPKAEGSRKGGVFVSLLLLTFFFAIPIYAGPSKVSLQGPRLELPYAPSSIAVSETTVTGFDFGYLVEGAFLDLINTRFTSVSYAITLENLPGTTASPSSGTIPPQSVQSVLIFTDRSNIPIGEYSGKVRVIFLPDDTVIVPLHYFVADTIFGVAFTPPQDSVVQPGTAVNFGHQVFFTLWSKNTAAVNWHVKNQDGVRISRNFNATLTSKGNWEWLPEDTVTIPNGTPTVTSISSMTPTGNPTTDDFFSVTYQTGGGPPATTRGDLNNDGFLTPADVVLELNLVFLGQVPPAGAAEGDVNCDGRWTPADVVLLLNKVFLNVGILCT